jgi:hypothetical protein
VKILTVLVAAAILSALSTTPADARWFEPQPHWWSSGRLCVASREPAGRRSETLPPRSCRVGEERDIPVSFRNFSNDFAFTKQKVGAVGDRTLASVERRHREFGQNIAEW